MAPLCYNIVGHRCSYFVGDALAAPKIMPGKGTDFYNEQKEDKD